MQGNLKLLDAGIARLREKHAHSDDALAHRQIAHSLNERAEILAKLL